MSSSDVFWREGADHSEEWCVYQIEYKGDKVPPFYIGYTRVSRIIDRNYHGSVTSRKWSKLWHKEVEQSPHLFSRTILMTFEDERAASSFEHSVLKFCDAANSDHFANMTNGGMASGYTRKGLTNSPDHNSKISASNSGENNGMFGRTGENCPGWKREKSPEEIEKIRQANLGRTHSAETIAKMTATRTGQKRGPYKKKIT